LCKLKSHFVGCSDAGQILRRECARFHVQEAATMRIVTCRLFRRKDDTTGKVMKQMRTFSAKITVAAAIASLSAFAGAKAEDASTSKKSQLRHDASAAGTPTSANSSLTAQDKRFIENAAKGGMMEVQMGKMAEQQGQSAEVKKIGARMVADHSKANGELMSVAQKKGVKVEKTAAKMEKMNSASFDQEYLAMMVKDHEKDAAEFEKELKQGQDADVKAFARTTLPVIKAHLAMVKDASRKKK
jgi:putative membrane protein